MPPAASSIISDDARSVFSVAVTIFLLFRTDPLMSHFFVDRACMEEVEDEA
jgi:hypothetical protein